MKQKYVKIHVYLHYFWALAVCLLLSPIMQSCSDDYDDTELRDAIAQIENRLKVF